MAVFHRLTEKARKTILAASLVLEIISYIIAFYNLFLIVNRIFVGECDEWGKQYPEWRMIKNPIEKHPTTMSATICYPIWMPVKKVGNAA